MDDLGLCTYRSPFARSFIYSPNDANKYRNRAERGRERGREGDREANTERGSMHLSDDLVTRRVLLPLAAD